MGRPYSNLPTENWQAKRLPQLGGRHKKLDGYRGEIYQKVSSIPARSLKVSENK